MTTLEEDVAVDVDTASESTSSPKKGRKRDLDFTKVRETHQELADYVNAHSGIDPLSANQVKALLTLRTDWAATPEQEAKRADAKAAREAAAQKYEGLSAEQIAIEKSAEKAEKQAAKLRERVDEALAKAKAIREGTEASGSDIAAAVQADQNGSVEFSEATSERKGRFGRNK